jgi:ribosomal protein L40E
MDDHELAQKFIKIEPEAGNINVLVRKIGWSGPYTPVSTWELAVKLNSDISSTEINAEIHKTLNNKQYFQVCKECGERNPRGWMYNKSICQSCAERNHGIVH